MKRVLLAGVTAAALLGLAGSAQAADKKTLVFVVNGASDFWKAAEAGVKKAQGELPNYKLDFKISRTIVCGDPDPPDG
jgi:ribose transport system substrate-binding protein